MQDFGKLLLRLTVGGLMLPHGISKITNGIGDIDKSTGLFGALAAEGWPEWIAYGVYVGEVVAPALLIVGLFCRPAALISAVNMGVAVYLAHFGELKATFSEAAFNDHGAYVLETQAFYFLCSLAILFIGPGRISLDGGRAPSEIS